MKIDPTKLNYGRELSMENLQRLFGAIGDSWVVKLCLGTLISVNDWFFHPRHDTVTIVLAFVALDTLTGFIKAFKEQKVSSSGFFRAFVKLTVYMTMLATGALLDKLVALDALISALSIVASFLSITEAISVLENTAAIGFKVPMKLVSMLKFVQQGGDKD
jgi:toxin secretion/phage lysis holin